MSEFMILAIVFISMLVDTFPSIGGGNATIKDAMILSKGKEN